MTFDEICNALDQGKTVCWGNPGYNVIRDVASHQLYIKCLSTGHVAPLLHNGELPNAGMDFRILEQPGGDPPAADPVRRVWLLDLRATCLVDAVDEASARQAWEAGLEYEYEIDNEGGLLRVEPFHGREPRPADAPGELRSPSPTKRPSSCSIAWSRRAPITRSAIPMRPVKTSGPANPPSTNWSKPCPHCSRSPAKES